MDKVVNEFKLKLNMSDVVTITNRAADTTVRQVKDAMDAGATLEDLRTVEVLSALSSFMIDRRCDPGFELDFN